MTVSIWARLEDKAPGVIDTVSNPSQAAVRLHEWRVGLSALGGKYNQKPKWMVWAGTKKDEPIWQLAVDTRRWMIVNGV